MEPKNLNRPLFDEELYLAPTCFKDMKEFNNWLEVNNMHSYFTGKEHGEVVRNGANKVLFDFTYDKYYEDNPTIYLTRIDYKSW
jgi:hypothetical protein